MHRFALLSLFLTMASTASAELIVLTFPTASSCASNINGSLGPAGCTGNARIYQGYGDTAGVNFTYVDVPSSPNSLQWWSTGYPGLTNVVWAYDYGRIEMAPLVDEVLTLESLDVATWLGASAPFTVRVLDLLTSAELYTSGVVNLGASSVHLTPGVSSLNGLALVWDDLGQGAFGLDNITVNADPVPEPSTFALVALALCGAGFKRRRTPVRPEAD